MSKPKNEVTTTQVQIRVPHEVKRWLAKEAKLHGSSMGFEASRRLKQVMADESSNKSAAS